ncbi:hypothetical protein DFH11DRAFT_1644536, partial [Phellopilus nigrolimitatus]
MPMRPVESAPCSRCFVLLTLRDVRTRVRTGRALRRPPCSPISPPALRFSFPLSRRTFRTLDFGGVYCALALARTLTYVHVHTLLFPSRVVSPSPVLPSPVLFLSALRFVVPGLCSLLRCVRVSSRAARL